MPFLTSRLQKKSQTQASKRHLQFETLEGRQMLSGVTLITHGFGSNADEGGWVQQMGQEVVSRIEERYGSAAHTQIDIELSDELLATQISHVEQKGNPWDTTSTGEVIVYLDWSALAGSLVTPIQLIDNFLPTSTSEVAQAVAPVLLTTLTDLGHSEPLASLPLHLIGHSRGGSLVSALAQELGQHGVWVDQLTTLDPHPVDGIWEPLPDLVPPDQLLQGVDFGDAPAIVSQNVVFADNYWRQEHYDPNDAGQNGPYSLDFTGQPVPGAHDLRLDETILEKEGYRFLKDFTFTPEHSDARLWYHGTIDTEGDFSDGRITIHADTQWYNHQMGPRHRTGYHYSRIAGGVRPSDGIAERFGGEGARELVSLSVPELDAWDNVIVEGSLNGLRLNAGELLSLAVLYEDLNQDAEITMGFDTNTNPYDGVVEENQVIQSTALYGVDNEMGFFLPTTGLDDTYYVFAKISGEHTRYAYAQGTIEIASSPEATALSVSISASKDTKVKPGDQILISGRATYNNHQPVSTGTAVISFRDQTWTAQMNSDGSYQRHITVAENALDDWIRVRVTSGDPANSLSGDASLRLDILRDSENFGYTIWSDIAHSYGLKERDGSQDVFARKSRHAWSPTQSGDLRGLVHLENDGDILGRLRVVIRGPDGSKIQMRQPDGSLATNYKWDVAVQGWQWAWWGWDGIPDLDQAGIWTYEWSFAPVPDVHDFQRIATNQFVYRYDFTNNSMRRTDGSGDTNVFYQDDQEARSSMILESVAESLDIRWEFYDPNGQLHSIDETMTAAPERDGYIPSVTSAGVLKIDNELASQKTGEWYVDAYVKDVSGKYDLVYRDYFYISEKSGTPPTIDVSHSPSDELAGPVSLDVEVVDNGYLDTVWLHWFDQQEHSVKWPDLFRNSFRETVVIEPAVGSSTVQYWVTASDTSGNKISTAAETIAIRPLAPEHLEVIDATTTKVQLAWDDKSSNEEGFRIDRQVLGQDDWLQLGSVGRNTTTFEDSSAAPETDYQYRVRAYHEAGVSDWSESIATTTRPAVTVLNHHVGSGSSQRSTVRSVSMSFSDDVGATLDSESIQIRDINKNVVVASSALLHYDETKNTASWDFEPLALGNYEVTLPADGIATTTHEELVEDYRFEFHVLPGDINGDRKVESEDLMAILVNYLKPPGPERSEIVDINGDGNVDVEDLQFALKHYGDYLETPFEIVVSTHDLRITEGSTAELAVELSQEPVGTVDVLVDYTGGDDHIRIDSSRRITFDSSNWNIPQSITISADKRFGIKEGSAQIVLAAREALNEPVVLVTEQDSSSSGVDFVDDFEDELISDSWNVGGRKISSSTTDAGEWTWAHEEVTKDDNGFLQIQVQGPTSGGTRGAAAWATSNVDLNDGNAHQLEFRWNADVSDNKGNLYFVQITDGVVPAFEEVPEEFYAVGEQSVSYAEGTRDFLYRPTRVGLSPGVSYLEDTDPAEYSLLVTPDGTATLKKQIGTIDEVVSQQSLNPDRPWLVRFMVADLASQGFPTSDTCLRVYDIRSDSLEFEANDASDQHNPSLNLQSADRVFRVLTTDLSSSQSSSIPASSNHSSHAGTSSIAILPKVGPELLATEAMNFTSSGSFLDSNSAEPTNYPDHGLLSSSAPVIAGGAQRAEMRTAQKDTLSNNSSNHTITTLPYLHRQMAFAGMASLDVISLPTFHSRHSAGIQDSLEQLDVAEDFSTTVLAYSIPSASLDAPSTRSLPTEADELQGLAEERVELSRAGVGPFDYSFQADKVFSELYQ